MLSIAQVAVPVPADVACATLTLSRSNERQGANTIGGSVGLITNANTCVWSAKTDAVWVVITQGASGKGNSNVQYQIQANPTTDERKATLTVAGGTGAVATLTIYQASEATNLVSKGGAEGGGGDGGGDGGGGSGGGGEGAGG